MPWENRNNRQWSELIARHGGGCGGGGHRSTVLHISHEIRAGKRRWWWWWSQQRQRIVLQQGRKKESKFGSFELCTGCGAAALLRPNGAIHNIYVIVKVIVNISKLLAGKLQWWSWTRIWSAEWKECVSEGVQMWQLVSNGEPATKVTVHWQVGGGVWLVVVVVVV